MQKGGAALFRYQRGTVTAAIVYDNDFVNKLSGYVIEHTGQCRLFIQRRDDDGYFFP